MKGRKGIWRISETSQIPAWLTDLNLNIETE